MYTIERSRTNRLGNEISRHVRSSLYVVIGGDASKGCDQVSRVSSLTPSTKSSIARVSTERATQVVVIIEVDAAATTAVRRAKGGTRTRPLIPHELGGEKPCSARLSAVTTLLMQAHDLGSRGMAEMHTKSTAAGCQDSSEEGGGVDAKARPSPRT